MKIYEWTRIDNLPFNIGSELEYIREEAESLGELEEWEVLCWVRDKFENDYPQFFRELRYENVVNVEYYLFESDSYTDEDRFPGYAIYIHLHKELVTKIVNHVLDKHPDHVLRYLNWVDRITTS